MTGREQQLVADVIDSNYLNDGDVTRRFERALADLLGARFAVAVTSGTSAIFVALAAHGIGAGDEVIVPDVTFIATANAVRLTGATPVLVDVERATLNISADATERAITPRTRAIVPVHVSGRGADMAPILDIAKRHGIVVVEDAAEALLSAIDGKYLGTFGAAGCFSFSPNKTITTGQGGLVVTDDAALHTRLREVKDHGRATTGTGGDDLHPVVGYNFKMTNMQAAVGLAQLTELTNRAERQKAIYRRYVEQLRDVPGITLPGFALDRGECPQWVDAVVEQRAALCRQFDDAGIGYRRFWLPIHTQTPYREADDRFPNTMWLAERAMWLPSAFTLTDADIDLVCQHIRTTVSAPV
jgi:perosamine synthetase